MEGTVDRHAPPSARCASAQRGKVPPFDEKTCLWRSYTDGVILPRRSPSSAILANSQPKPPARAGSLACQRNAASAGLRNEQARVNTTTETHELRAVDVTRSSATQTIRGRRDGILWTNFDHRRDRLR